MNRISKQKKKFQFLSSIIIVLFLLSNINSCKKLNPFEAPRVSFQKVEYKNIDFNGVDLDFVVMVNNPNFIGLTVKQFYYEFFLEGDKLVNGFKTDITEIKAKSKNEIVLPVSIDFSSLQTSLSALFEKDKLAYELKGYVIIDTPLGEMKFEFENYDFHKGFIPIPTIPELSLENIGVKEFSFSNIQIELAVKLTNTNDFSFSLNDFSYMLVLNGITISKAKVSSKTNLKAGEELNIKIPVNLKLINLQIGLLNALKQNEINYNLFVNLYIDSNKGPIKMPLRREGVVSIIK